MESPKLVIGSHFENALKQLEAGGFTWSEHRVVRPNQAITCEYRMTRLNLFVNDLGIVTDVSFG